MQIISIRIIRIQIICIQHTAIANALVWKKDQGQVLTHEDIRYVACNVPCSFGIGSKSTRSG